MSKPKTDKARWFVTFADLWAFLVAIAQDHNAIKARLDKLEAAQRADAGQ